ncbi:uncharacterized protein TrAtP1_001743 [Trichoderma atroviride]|uniref:uncharacterized protein n=1 Tax=Hypocrea atroviridis TaxID=63577 RepID=UPI00331DF558|nr:hypothetical protein TrAtP1_001743 [Trichoderma atroviride]
MQRNVQGRMQHYTLITVSLLGLFISLSLARFSQLSALQPLAGPSAGAASAFANQKQPSFTAQPVLLIRHHMISLSGLSSSVPLDDSHRICPLPPSLYPTQSLIHS